jgi:hypothetical protein
VYISYIDMYIYISAYIYIYMLPAGGNPYPFAKWGGIPVEKECMIYNIYIYICIYI